MTAQLLGLLKSSVKNVTLTTAAATAGVLGLMSYGIYKYQQSLEYKNIIIVSTQVKQFLSKPISMENLQYAVLNTPNIGRGVFFHRRLQIRDSTDPDFIIEIHMKTRGKHWFIHVNHLRLFDEDDCEKHCEKFRNMYSVQENFVREKKYYSEDTYYSEQSFFYYDDLVQILDKTAQLFGNWNLYTNNCSTFIRLLVNHFKIYCYSLSHNCKSKVDLMVGTHDDNSIDQVLAPKTENSTTGSNSTATGMTTETSSSISTSTSTVPPSIGWDEISLI